MSMIPKETAEQLAQLIRAWNAKGFSPATSTNYSFRVGPNSLAISKSGRDKSQFSAQDFMLVDLKGKALAPFENERSSAETLLHTVLYEENEAINVVLHTHSIYGTLLSDYYLKEGHLQLSQYELLKALPQFDTHEVDFKLPIFPNTQDIEQLSKDFRQLYLAQPRTIAYLIAGHGLYTWGKSIAEAKRHLEALEFLLEVHYKKLLLAPR
ncbi:methylthioribulose 1-phosphate dehydratase [Saprospira sp. CCB-QB6]|uniref:methylthioribulose 1-phosphate dehydratase n=1 Tax=Saprospira sp. CCB-QB6 TaxID=3023936 RepID=UPI00234A226A|nr:methylthioribulose 1-phosphate dehydratase [Saprospira sp. CCB-QB6]WCL82951.1 methylthioribulose 1-phosphate dehydratase [Saprospira sp. CCB-QB6]